MRSMFLGVVALMCSMPAFAANQYFGLSYNTTTGTATQRVSGRFVVAKSSNLYKAYILDVNSAVGITISTGVTISSGAYFGSGATVSTFTATGILRLHAYTKAQINAMTPAVGDQIRCLDCAVAGDVCVGSGTLSGFVALVNSIVNSAPKGCGTDN